MSLAAAIVIVAIAVLLYAVLDFAAEQIDLRRRWRGR